MEQTSSSKTSSKPKKKVNGAKKGRQFEREVANAIGHIFPEAKRMLEYQASDVIGVDIEGTDPFLIQCKNHQGYCSVSTIGEVRLQRKDQIPVLVTKGNRLEAMAILPFEKFVTLLEVAYGHRPLFAPPAKTLRVVQSVDLEERNALLNYHGESIEDLETIEWEEVESPFKQSTATHDALAEFI